MTSRLLTFSVRDGYLGAERSRELQPSPVFRKVAKHEVFMKLLINEISNVAKSARCYPQRVRTSREKKNQRHMHERRSQGPRWFLKKNKKTDTASVSFNKKDLSKPSPPTTQGALLSRSNKSALESMPARTDLGAEAPGGYCSESAHKEEDEERGVEEVIECLADGTCQQRKARMQRRALRSPYRQRFPASRCNSDMMITHLNDT